MTLDAAALGVVLAAALLHAGWNALVAGPGDRLLSLALVMLGAGLVYAPLLPWLGAPPAQMWPYLLGSTVLHALYQTLLFQGYEAGHLGVVYPLARGSAPVWLALFAVLLVGESLQFGQVVALALLCAGLVYIAASGGRMARRPVLIALTLGLTIASYSLVDGLATRHSPNALLYVAWQALLSGLPLVAFTAYRRGRALSALPRAVWLRGLAGGAIAGLAYGGVLWAMTRGSLAVVSGLRETSIVFGVLLGWLVLGEPQGPQRLIGAAVVTAGALALAYQSV